MCFVSLWLSQSLVARPFTLSLCPPCTPLPYHLHPSRLAHLSPSTAGVVLPSTSAYLATVPFLFHSWPSTTSQTIHSVCGPHHLHLLYPHLWHLLTFDPHLCSASSCDPPHVTSGAQSLCFQAPGHLSCVSPIHPIHCHPSPYPLSPSPLPSFLNRPHHFTVLTASLPL